MCVSHYILEVDDSTALEFWQEHEKHYHQLSMMARIYSGISWECACGISVQLCWIHADLQVLNDFTV